MATLKISDLSVGDWVQVLLRKCDYDEPDTFKAKVLTVVNNSVGVGYDNSGIVMSAFVEDLQPIPITAEILEKNGFERPDKKVYMDTWSWTNKEDTMIEVGMYKDKVYIRVTRFEDDIQRDRDCNFGLKYIHQLQHTLRLAGVDKEINL